MTIWSCDTCLRDQSFRATETPISAKRVTPSNYTYTHRRTHAHTCKRKHIKDLCTHFKETFPCVFMNTTVIYTTLWSCWVARYTLFGKIYLESCFEHLYNVNQKGVEEINRRRWERQIHKQISGWERVNIEVFERINTGLVKRVCLVKTSHFLQLFLVTRQVCEKKGYFGGFALSLLCSRKGNMLDWI